MIADVATECAAKKAAGMAPDDLCQEKLPETTPNATFSLTTKLVIFRVSKAKTMISVGDNGTVMTDDVSAIPARIPANVARIAQEYDRYLNGRSYAEVAAHFGVTKASVSQYVGIQRRLPAWFVSWLGKCSEPHILRQFSQRRLREVAQKSEPEQLRWLREIAGRLDKEVAAVKELLDALAIVDRLNGAECGS